MAPPAEIRWLAFFDKHAMEGSFVDAKHIVGSCSRVRLKISRSHTLKADSDMGPAISSSIKHARLFDREQRWSKDLNATRDKKVVNDMTATTGYRRVLAG